MPCKQCGQCCRALVVPISPQEASRFVRHNFPFHDFTLEETLKNDTIFIAKHLKPLTHEQAVKINPTLKLWDLNKDQYAYSCPFLTDDNKCSIHDKLLKKGMCNGFPWYDKTPDDRINYNPECGYLKDLE